MFIQSITPYNNYASGNKTFCAKKVNLQHSPISNVLSKNISLIEDARKEFFDVYKKFFKDKMPKIFEGTVESCFKNSTATEHLARTKLLLGIKDNEYVYNNDNFMSELISLMYEVANEDTRVEKILAVFGVISANEVLTKNKNLTNNLGAIAWNSGVEEGCGALYINYLKYYINNKLYEIPAFEDNLIFNLIQLKEDNAAVIYTLLESLNNNEKFSDNKSDIPEVIKSVHTKEEGEIKLKLLETLLKDDYKFNGLRIFQLLVAAKSETDLDNINANMQIAKSFIPQYSEDYYKGIQSLIRLATDKIDTKLLENLETEETLKTMSKIKDTVLKHPGLYIEGSYKSDEEYLAAANELLESTYIPLCILTKVLDKETIDYLLRLRSSNIAMYCSRLLNFTAEELDIAKTAVNECEDETPAREKMEIFNFTRLAKYIGVLNDEHGLDDDIGILLRVFVSMGMTPEEIDKIDKEHLAMMSEYIGYYPQLYETYCNANETTQAVLRAILPMTYDELADFVCQQPDFNNQIAIFQSHGLEIGQWLATMPEPIELSLINQGENINKIIANLKNDIEALRGSPAGVYFDKVYSDSVIKGEFQIPVKAMSSKQELQKYIRTMIQSLNKIWSRANKNLSVPELKTQAQQTLTIRDHLLQRLNDLDEITGNSKTSTLDLSISLWGREPFRDLFQGNYSTCCIGMDRCNYDAIIDYIISPMYNMIEIVNNETNLPIGNALIYFVEEEDGSVALMIDNIEINNTINLSKEHSKELRNQIVEYAELMATISNKDWKYMPVYLGKRYNDVVTDDLKTVKKVLQPVGYSNYIDGNQYMDAFGGWRSRNFYAEEIEVYNVY